MRNLLLILTATATFFVFTGFTSVSEKEISKCPYIQKLHQADKELKCPYLQKNEVKEKQKKSDSKCPFSGKSMDKEKIKNKPDKKLKFT